MERCAKHINLLYIYQKGVLFIEEIWKDVNDYEGVYQVSNLGRVRSLDRIIKRKNGVLQKTKGKIIHICHNKRVNVYEVHLNKDSKRKCFKIHRLVAIAFVENDDPINKTTVNHKDGDRANNKANNLEWASYSENEKHAYDKLHRPTNRAKLKKRQCICVDKNTNLKTVYESIEATSRGTGVSQTQIRRIANKECINKNYHFIIEGINN